MRLAPFILLALGCSPSASDDTDKITEFRVDIDKLVFGDVLLGQPKTLSAVFSCCTGNQQIVIESALLSNSDQDVFIVTLPDDSVIKYGANVMVSVTFQPVDSVDYSGTIEVFTDFRQAPIPITVRGSGRPPSNDNDNDGDGFSVADGDCDDNDPNRAPDLDELCDGIDNDCDDIIPSNEQDADSDGYSECEGDCNELRDDISPGMNEICDGEDTDCDGVNQDLLDSDGDGFTACGTTPDCDDQDATVYPGNPDEICDSKDNDCNSLIDDLDEDADGHSPCSPGGDCNDNNAAAYPVVMSTTGSTAGTGTDADPVSTLSSAVGKFDNICRSIRILPGTYSDILLNWTSTNVTIAGTGANPTDTVLQPPADRRIFDVGSSGVLTLENLTLSGADMIGDGAAIRVTGGDLTLKAVHIVDNISSRDGGGITMLGGTTTVGFGCLFENNTAGRNGGAVYVDTGDWLDEQGSSYLLNTGTDGGAIFHRSGSFVLRDAHVADNDATSEGGAIYASGTSATVIERCNLWSNTAGSRGGAIALASVIDPNGGYRNNFIQGNASSGVGGGFSISGGISQVNVINNTFTDNSAANHGATLHIDAADSSQVVVWSNLSGWAVGDSAFYLKSGLTADVLYNSAWQTSSGPGSAFAGALNPANTSNHSDEDPLFVAYSDDGDPSNDSLDLTPASPARNTGPTNSSFNDPDGSQNDRGATGGPAAQ